MRMWFSRPARLAPPHTHRRQPKPARPPGTLVLERLEGREVPAVTIQFDYSYDTSGFFNDPAKRAVLQQVANDVGSQLTSQLAAIAPGGGNVWNESFINPVTGQLSTVTNPVVPANTIVVYVGGRPMGGGEAGEGGGGGYGASGSNAWFDVIRTRGAGGFAPWGGSIAFDPTANWYTGTSAAGLRPNQVDLYSVASHELGHVLGIGTAPQWFSQVGGGVFTGPNAESVYGGPVPVYGDNAHWADGLGVNGQRAALDPILPPGGRVSLSPLDYAALRDLGWSVATPTRPTVVPSVSPPVVTPVSPPPVPRPVSPPPVGNPSARARPVILTGVADGTARPFADVDGSLVASGPPITPFPGFTGTIRSVVADFTGDGAADYAFGTGPGTAGRVRIIDGKTGTDVVGPTTVLDGFGGGLYVAAGDVDRDGRAELAVSADAGGGTRVTVFEVGSGALAPVANFFAFGDAAFRGGSRVAMGDVNRDGSADLIVGAGLGGGPRVAVYDGAALAAGSLVKLVPDFFALDPSLRSGVFVTSADLDGDGFSDVIYSTGNTGGPRVRVVGGATLTTNPGQDAYALPALADFYALDPADRTGLRITARDLDGDGKAELVVANGSTTRPQVRVVSLSDLPSPEELSSGVFNPFPGDPLTADGVFVG